MKDIIIPNFLRIQFKLLLALYLAAYILPIFLLRSNYDVLGAVVLAQSEGDYLKSTMYVLLFLFVAISIPCLFVGVLKIFRVNEQLGRGNLELSFSLIIAMSIICFIATIVSKLKYHDLAIENLITIASKFSIVVAYVAITHSKNQHIFYKKYMLIVCAIFNSIAYLGSSLAFGYSVSALYFLSIAIVLLLRCESHSTRFALFLALLIFGIAFSFYEQYKGDLRDILYSGHYVKDGLAANTGIERINGNLVRCDQSISKIIVPEIISNEKLVGDSRIIEYAETGKNSNSKELVATAIGRKYSFEQLFNINDLPNNINKLARSEQSLILAYAYSRGWGNRIPRDGSRAINLLLMYDGNRQVRNYLIAKHMLAGNGINPNIPSAVTCFLESNDDQILYELLNSERGDIRSIVNEVVDFSCEINDQCEIRNRVKKIRMDIKSERVAAILDKISIKPYKILTAPLKRINQQGNLAIALNEHRYRGEIGDPNELFKDYIFAIIPRFIYPNKPIIQDRVGLAVANYFGLADPAFSKMSWALPLLPESVLVFGSIGVVFAGLFVAIIYILYFTLSIAFPSFYNLLTAVLTTLIADTLIHGLGGLFTNTTQMIIVCVLLIAINYATKNKSRNFHT